MSKKPSRMRAAIIREVERRGLSIKQLHEASGVPYASCYALVKGSRDIGLTSLEKVCNALGLELKPKSRPQKRKGGR